jgi:RND superfamily putative drug exporter
VLVFDAGEGKSIVAPENMAYVARISEWLIGPEGPGHIQSVLSPTLNPEAAGNLIAPDGQVGMVVVALNTSDLDLRANVLDDIGDHLADTPSELRVYRTGEVAIGREYNERSSRALGAALVSVVRSRWRSSFSRQPLIPLGSDGGLWRTRPVALAQSVFTVTDIATMLLIVVMYGAGTDYCLFLISRFREEMADSHEPRASMRSTVRRVGESISSSAGTVITGFMAMSLAQLGLFNTTGPTLAVGVVVSLLAGLTLTPALLGVLGKWAFWPARPQHRDAGALYRRTSQWVSSRPLLTILGITLIMAPLAYHGSGMSVTYDFLADLPDDMESVEGFRALQEHVGAGEMQPGGRGGV